LPSHEQHAWTDAFLRSDAAIVTFQNVFDDNIVGAKQFGSAWTFMAVADVADRGCQDDQIFRRMKGGSHDIVIVAGQDAQTRAFVKVPQSL
jgi:hypothetical protein